MLLIVLVSESAQWGCIQAWLMVFHVHSSALGRWCSLLMFVWRGVPSLLLYVGGPGGSLLTSVCILMFDVVLSPLGDHFYKRNKNLPPEEQMISALPDLKVLTLNEDNDFMVIACDGIW